jgi:hypothetical protein
MYLYKKLLQGTKAPGNTIFKSSEVKNKWLGYLKLEDYT